MTAATENIVLEIRRVFDAPRARVFDAWLNREEWQAWIGPEGVRCEVPVLERRVGGRYRLIMHLSDGQVIPVTGVFKTIEAPKRLSPARLARSVAPAARRAFLAFQNAASPASSSAHCTLRSRVSPITCR
jgi:uncharacterized protein YndB with AHSA1/START domain